MRLGNSPQRELGDYAGAEHEAIRRASVLEVAELLTLLEMMAGRHARQRCAGGRGRARRVAGPHGGPEQDGGDRGRRQPAHIHPEMVGESSVDGPAEGVG